MPAETNRLAVLLDEDRRDIDAYTPVFTEALSRQASLLNEDVKGDRTPTGAAASPDARSATDG